MKSQPLLLTLFLLALTTASFAQSLQDVVYLKNGSVIRGIIIEQIPNQSLKIQTKDKSLFVYSFDEIESIKKEDATKAQKKEMATNEPEMGNGLKTGVNFEPGLIIAPVVEESDNGKKYILTNVQVTANCQLNPYIALGIGAAVRSYSFEDTYLPLYGQFRANFKNRPVSPYIETALGYGFYTGEGYNGGAMFNLSFGFAKKMSKGQIRFGLVIDAFDRKSADRAPEYDEFGNYYGYSDRLGAASFGLKLGFTF